MDWDDTKIDLYLDDALMNTSNLADMVSDIRVRDYKEIDGFDIPTEFLVLRNGRPFWREQYADVRINGEIPAGAFDQARWNDIPIPK